MSLVIGLDFDNTIVSYDGVFHAAAVERGLIPSETPDDKASVRGYLVERDQEDAWTELQGYVYGARMDLANLYPGVLGTIGALREAGHSLKIVSHKTRRPYAGPDYDLHEAAWGFLEAQGFFTEGGFTPEAVFFEEELTDKIARIASEGCQLYLDDLTKVLEHPDFDAAVTKVLFDPNNAQQDRGYPRITAWPQLLEVLA